MNSPALALPELFSPTVFLGAEVERMKTTSSLERGAIYTRMEVVEFILDLAGYTADRLLPSMRLLEPSFGSGDFLLGAIRRLLVAAKRERSPVAELVSAIRAVELHRDTFTATRLRVLELLRDSGFSEADALKLADA